MRDSTDIDRRTVIRGLGGLAVVGTLAGCSTDGGGGDGGDGSDGGDGGDTGGSDGGSDGGNGNAEVDDYLSDTTNYDSIEDMTGEDEVTVEVGVETDEGPYGFGPAAVRIDQGTTVVWEWTGEGSSHNVVHDDGDAFSSEMTAEEGHTFEHTFEETGTYLYVCEPHRGFNMNGAVVVE